MNYFQSAGQNAHRVDKMEIKIPGANNPQKGTHTTEIAQVIAVLQPM